MLKNFCHDQIKILLERMDTHPEEFLSQRKWDAFLPPDPSERLLHSHYKHFNKVEQILIRFKYKKIVKKRMRQYAYDQVLETLVFKPSESFPPHLGTPPSHLVHVKEHLKAMREELGN